MKLPEAPSIGSGLSQFRGSGFFHAPGSLPPSHSAIQGEKVSCFSNMCLTEDMTASGTHQCPYFTTFDENFIFWVSMRTLDGH